MRFARNVITLGRVRNIAAGLWMACAVTAGAQGSLTSVPPATAGVVTRCPASAVTLNASISTPFGESWSLSGTAELYERTPNGTWPNQPVRVLGVKRVPANNSPGSIYSYTATFTGVAPPTAMEYRVAFQYGKGLVTPTPTTSFVGPILVKSTTFTVLAANHAWSEPPLDGAPIKVSLDLGPRLNISKLASCGGMVNVMVQESNRWWDRSYAHEWGRWFDPRTLNLQDMNVQYLTTFYSASDGTDYFTLLGSTISSTKPPGAPALVGQKRYYRVGVQVGGTWAPQWALLEVDW